MKKTTKRMRRFSAIVLCISMIIGILPIMTPKYLKTTKAAETNATSDNILPGLNDYSAEHYLPRANFYFNDEDILLYDQLVKAANDVMEGKYTDFEGEICVPYFSVPELSREAAEHVANVFLLENPLYFWIEYMSYGKTVDGYSVSFKIRDEYKNYNALTNKWKQIKVEIEKYLAKAEGAPDDYTKAYILYKELTSNNTYRYDANGEPSTEATASTIEGIFLENSGVCEAFASAYALLLSLAGIENCKIRGWTDEGIGHAWNVVWIGADFYLCDATWDVEKTDDFSWFMVGYKANYTHIISKQAVTVDIPERYNYQECGVVYYALSADDNYNKQPKEAPLVTIPIMYDSQNEKVEVYNNGMLVTINNGSVTVVEGTTLTVDAFSGDKMPIVGVMNGSQPEQYIDGFEAKSGKKIVIGFSNDVVESVSPAYKVELARDGKTGTALVDLTLKSGRVLKEKTVTLTRNEAAVNAFMASDDFKEIVPDDVWCDRAAFDYGLLHIDTLYDAEIDELSSDITMDDAVKKFQLTALQRGDDTHIVYSNAPGYELRVFGLNNKMYPSSSAIPVGEPLTIKLFDGYSEVPAKFYCSTGDESSPKLIDKDTFMPAGLSYITWEPEDIDNTLVSVAAFENSFKVENGLAPEEVAAMILPAATKITLKDGRVMNAKIEWSDFSEYNCSRKEAEMVTVRGTVVLPEKIENPLSVPLDIQATLEVKKAEIITMEEMKFESIIPSEIHVANGTPMEAAEIGLTPIYHRYHEFSRESGRGSTSLLLKYKWTYDADLKKMLGSLDTDGFVCYDDPYEVAIIEEDGGITVPDESMYNIKFTDANGAEIDSMYPKSTANHKGLLSIKLPQAEQTNREIIVTVPRGFKNVAVFNANLIEGVEAADVTTDSYGISTITIKVADDYDIEKTLNVEFSYTPIYYISNSSTGKLASFSRGQYFNQCKDDLGLMYPIGAEIPFKLAYKADENESTGMVNLPISNRPKMKSDANFVNFFSSGSNEIKQSTSQNVELYSQKASIIYNTSPYITSLIGVYPTPDIINSPVTNVQALRYGTSYNNTDSLEFMVGFQNGKPEGQYTSAPGYVVCKDVFGEVYTVTSNATTKLTIKRASDMIASGTWEDPYRYEPFKHEEMLIHAFPEGGTNTESIVGIADFSFKTKTNQHQDYVYGPIRVSIEIPDGTMPSYLYLSRGADYMLYYTDGTNEFVPSISVPSEHNCDCLMRSNTALGRGEKRVKEVVATCNMNPWQNNLLEVAIALEAYPTYSDGTPVALGSYLYFDSNQEIKTNCPKVTGNITVENATILDTATYDAYLIGYGVTGLEDANFSTNDSWNTVYNYANGSPSVSEIYELVRTSLGDEPLYDIKLVADVADAELFHINEIYNIKDASRITIYYTNGKNETYESGQFGNSIQINTDEHLVSRYEVTWDSSDFMEGMYDSGCVSLKSNINFDRYMELYGKDKQNVKMLSGSLYAEGTKVKDLDDYYVNIATQLVDTQYYGVYLYSYYKDPHLPKVTYSNTNSLSVESKVEQSDYAYVQWFMPDATYDSFKKVGPHHMKSCTFTLTIDNGGEIDPTHDCYLEYGKYLYDEDADGVKDMTVQEAGTIKANKIQKIKDGQYEITFENFYAAGKEKIYIPIRGTMNTTRNINATLGLSKVELSEKQEYVVSADYKKYLDITYVGKAYDGNKLTANIQVLTAYTEKVEGFGISECNQDPYAEIYKIASDETFTYKTQIFNSPNAQMNKMEMVIQIPKKGQKLIVPAKPGAQRKVEPDSIYDQEFTAILKNVSVPTATDKNYKTYYTLNGTDWLPFSTLDDISDVTKVQSIKVTADKALHGDQIALTFDSEDGAKGTSNLVTAFSYKDSNSGMDKSGYTRVVPFAVTNKVELRVPTDRIDFGEFHEGSSMTDILKQIELESIGCRPVPNVKLTFITGNANDTPEAFELNGDFASNSTTTLNPVPADSTVYVDANIANDYQKGTYNAVVRVEWEDDNGAGLKDIPVLFSVVGTKKLTYHSNTTDEVSSMPDQLTTYDSKVTVSADVPVREGYTFKGWSYTPENQGGLVVAGATIALDDDVDLYAIWADSSKPQDPDPVTPDPEDPNPTPEDPEPTPSVDPTPDEPGTTPSVDPNTPAPDANIEAPDGTETSTPTKGPKTGDETPIGWLFTLCLLSAGGLLIVKKRKNKL